MSIFYDTIEQVPEDQRENYIESEFDDKKGFQHKQVVSLVNALKKEREEKAHVKGKWEEHERKEAERLTEIERQAYEKAKKDGNFTEIEKRLNQQLEDEKRRSGETTKQFQERIEKMANQIKTEKRSAVVSDLSEMATDKGRAAFKRLVASRIDVDAETGKVTFLNDDGSASSLDLAGFKAEISQDETLSPLLKSDVVTSGGGKANGSTDGSAPVKTMKRDQFQQLNSKQQMAFVKDGGKIT